MGERRAEGGAGGGESQKERVDRELIELLNELRVSLPGVQVLFAFLLTVPFSSGFARLTGGQRSWYFATFLATAGASAFLMAPTSYHRILFRKDDKEQMIRTANRFAIAGTALLSLAIGGAVFVVADVMYATSAAGLTTGVVVAGVAWLWFGLPLWRRTHAG
jgi:VIT1/CCC1 family predicted Fe2+/Mn2+ transporter